MIRGIAFDLFDTLVDQDRDRLARVRLEGRTLPATTPQLHRHAVERAGVELSLIEFAELQREVDRALFRETLEQGLELPTQRRFDALAEAIGQAGDRELSAGLTEIHMGLLRETVSIPEHHESILAGLAVQHRLALCSNFSHAPTARSILSEARLEPHLQAVVISEEVGIRKPRPEIFQAVARGLGLEPEEVLHVGDDLRADVQGAAACGMKTVWLTRRIPDPESALAEYDGPRPDFALEDLLDLPVLAARLAV